MEILIKSKIPKSAPKAYKVSIKSGKDVVNVSMTGIAINGAKQRGIKIIGLSKI